MSKPADVICEGDVCRRVTPEEAAAHHVAAADGDSSLSGALAHLGPELLGKDGAKVPLSDITGPGKIIGLYFSAHWCPPCRRFTPELAAAFQRFRASHARKDDFNIVFVSSDREEQSFDEYFKDMPWLALPFDKREAKTQLSKLLKVRGIPTLAILDGHSGELITAQGRDAIAEDEDCANFPWRPRSVLQVLQAAPLQGKGTTVDAGKVLADKVVMLYFSAHWCPPCRRFTPKLVESYKKLQDGGKGVEVVFVSGDRDEASFDEYFNEMPWLAVPFEDSARKAELNMLFEVEGIPTLVVVGSDGKTITSEGVAAVSSDPDATSFPWHPKALDELTGFTAPRVNEAKAMLLVADCEEPAAAAALGQSVLGPVAEATKAGPHADDWSFFYVHRTADIANGLLGYMGITKPDQPVPAGAHLLLLLDVPSQCYWDLGAAGVAVSADGAGKAVADAIEGKLGEGKPLGGENDDE